MSPAPAVRLRPFPSADTAAVLALWRALLDETERLLRAVGCPKINLQVRRANSAAVMFYARRGFAPDDVFSMGRRLEHD